MGTFYGNRYRRKCNTNQDEANVVGMSVIAKEGHIVGWGKYCKSGGSGNNYRNGGCNSRTGSDIVNERNVIVWNGRNSWLFHFGREYGSGIIDSRTSLLSSIQRPRRRWSKESKIKKGDGWPINDRWMEKQERRKSCWQEDKSSRLLKTINSNFKNIQIRVGGKWWRPSFSLTQNQRIEEETKKIIRELNRSWSNW